MRPPRTFPLEELLLAQLVPGFLFAMGWTAMYEIYHEEGSYFTTLLQELLGSEGLFPYFLVLTILMSFPVGLVVDSVRHVVGEVWLGLPRTQPGRPPRTLPFPWIEEGNVPGKDFYHRYTLYRHVRATLLMPARTAGNLALVILVLTGWFVVKLIRMGSFHVFSPTLVIGTPLVGLGLAVVLLTQYAVGLGECHRQLSGVLSPPGAADAPAAMNDVHIPPS